jgi:hypothetical protein
MTFDELNTRADKFFGFLVENGYTKVIHSHDTLDWQIAYSKQFREVRICFDVRDQYLYINIVREDVAPKILRFNTYLRDRGVLTGFYGTKRAGQPLSLLDADSILEGLAKELKHSAPDIGIT